MNNTRVSGEENGTGEGKGKRIKSDLDAFLADLDCNEEWGIAVNSILVLGFSYFAAPIL